MKKLYMVSLGPGDFELVSLKALRVLKQSDAICVPTKSKGSFEKSISYKIVKKLMNEFGFNKEIIPLYAPMQFKKEDWQSQVDAILEAFTCRDKVSFVTLGDSAIYSSVYYLLDLIKEQNADVYENAEVIAGITSFSQASAVIKKPLCVGDSALEIVPLLGKDVPKTKIYMRPKIGMDTAVIKEQGSLYTFENLNFKDENIVKGKKSRVEKYMTLFIDFFR
ncbi:precorrin-2 C(20)-methyltransferase [Sulfurimonas sp.]|uniref:precorrin-2 C(20)-methyltransferase n=1 Tax=Sulfurimonas sp. TaxID=2022749 RepID=UPI002627ECB2|nr:precorrin-2 C(20)-methyltransferase [Sulfurimonas sp.]